MTSGFANIVAMKNLKRLSPWVHDQLMFEPQGTRVETSTRFGGVPYHKQYDIWMCLKMGNGENYDKSTGGISFPLIGANTWGGLRSYIGWSFPCFGWWKPPLSCCVSSWILMRQTLKVPVVLGSHKVGTSIDRFKTNNTFSLGLVLKQLTFPGSPRVVTQNLEIQEDTLISWRSPGDYFKVNIVILRCVPFGNLL